VSSFPIFIAPPHNVPRSLKTKKASTWRNVTMARSSGAVAVIHFLPPSCTRGVGGLAAKLSLEEKLKTRLSKSPLTPSLSSAPKFYCRNTLKLSVGLVKAMRVVFLIREKTTFNPNFVLNSRTETTRQIDAFSVLCCFIHCILSRDQTTQPTKEQCAPLTLSSWIGHSEPYCAAVI
jgi:hypothetical protein